MHLLQVRVGVVWTFFLLSGSVMVLGKLPVLGYPTIWMIAGQEPVALAAGVGWGCLDIFTLLYLYSPLSPSLGDSPI